MKTFLLAATFSFLGCATSSMTVMLNPRSGAHVECHERNCIEQYQAAGFISATLFQRLKDSGLSDEEALLFNETYSREIRKFIENSRNAPAERYAPESSRQPSFSAPANRDGNLVAACGAKGLGADFVTGNCVSSSGQQTNPANLYPPFQSPLSTPAPGDLI